MKFNRLFLQYKPSIPKWDVVEMKENITVGWGGCSDPLYNTMYLFGTESKLENWIEIITHEELHIVLFNLGIHPDYHHILIGELLD